MCSCHMSFHFASTRYILCCAVIIFLYVNQVVYSSTLIGTLCTDGIIFVSDTIPSNPGEVFSSARWVSPAKILTEGILVACPSSTHIAFNDFYEELKLELNRSAVDVTIDMVVNCARRCIYRKFPSIHIVVAGVVDCEKEAPEYKMLEILPGGSVMATHDFVVAGPCGSIAISALDRLRNEKTGTLSPVCETLPIICGAMTSTVKNRPGTKRISTWVMQGKRWRKL